MGNCALCKSGRKHKYADAKTAVGLKLDAAIIKSSNLAKALKPTVGQEITINRIKNEPDFYNLSTEEEHLIWRFRYAIGPDMLVKLL